MGAASLTLCQRKSAMRITIKLDAFDHTSESAFAVLWLDRENGRWSREGHECLDIPVWGTWKSEAGGMLLLDAATSNALLMLHGLRLSTTGDGRSAEGALQNVADKKWESQRGRADYFGCGANSEPRPLDHGHWHVQCVDRERIVAEHEVFSDEPDAVSGGSACPGDPGSFAT
ncbi:DUF3564 family protein [Caballeronia sp. CLC5]|uniref:DUF3564 family protein n=2 Tax=unclassified Caballeronia TaxID=2646786 RepID=UPI001F16B020|nr:DUF3564 family protein [Caballeronia sp. CLC5]MCE4569179.1 DUF3564 domain-containing protein [Caballeronia sp. CLC5]